MTIPLEAAQQRFDYWRKHKSNFHEPIPEELWGVVEQLSQHHPIATVVRVLGQLHLNLLEKTAE